MIVDANPLLAALSSDFRGKNVEFRINNKHGEANFKAVEELINKLNAEINDLKWTIKKTKEALGVEEEDYYD